MLQRIRRLLLAAERALHVSLDNGYGRSEPHYLEPLQREIEWTLDRKPFQEGEFGEFNVDLRSSLAYYFPYALLDQFTHAASLSSISVTEPSKLNEPS